MGEPESRVHRPSTTNFSAFPWRPVAATVADETEKFGVSAGRAAHAPPYL